MALQISNLWTRAMFSQQMGINDLPQSCAYFSAVDIDHVLRKEVDMDCITPSHDIPIPHGESLDIQSLLSIPSSRLDPSIISLSQPSIPLSSIPYTPRIPVMESLATSSSNSPSTDAFFLKAQITSNDQELRDVLKDQRKAIEAAGPPKIREKSTMNKGRSVFPYQAHADLMEEPIMVSDALAAGSQHNHRGAFPERSKSWGVSSWERYSTNNRPRATRW